MARRKLAVLLTTEFLEDLVVTGDSLVRHVVEFGIAARASRRDGGDRQLVSADKVRAAWQGLKGQCKSAVQATGGS